MTLAIDADRYSPEPRLAPEPPRWTYAEDWHDAADELGMEPLDWQAIAAEYLMAADEDGYWLWREYAIVVARQNGKTELLLPLIKDVLDHGGRVLHTAQNRELPREIYLRMVAWYESERPDDVLEARRANGQERLRLTTGGDYSIVAPLRGGRGRQAIDLLIVDEVREWESWAPMAALRPTITASPNPRVVFLSNAGSEESVVLNSLRNRAGKDPALCYLEWSPPEHVPAEDRDGWRWANPSPLVTMESLEEAFAALPRSLFQTEHLCQWVTTMAPSLIGIAAWDRLERPLEARNAPSMGIALDPTGTRASAVLAWPQSDGTLAVTMAAEVSGEPIDVNLFGKELGKLATRIKVVSVGFDPATDADLARHLPNAKPLGPREYAQASERFVRSVDGQRIRHWDAQPIGGDLPYTVRQEVNAGLFVATKAQDARPITAALAAVRAVWLAAAPLPAKPRVY